MSQDKSDAQPDFHIYLFVALMAIVIAIMLLPIALTGACVGLIILVAIRDRSASGIVDAACLTAFLLFSSVVLFGLSEDFTGLLFGEWSLITRKIVFLFVQKANSILPAKKQIVSVNPNHIRFYLWLLWPFAAATVGGSLYKKLQLPDATIALFDFMLNSMKRVSHLKLIVSCLLGILAALSVWKTDGLSAVYLLVTAALLNVYPKIRTQALKTLDFKETQKNKASPILIGQDTTSRQKITLSEAQMNHHVHIVGASGFGKSVLLSHMLKHQIEQGSGLLFVDLKADIETIDEMRAAAKASGRERDIQIFSCGNPKMSSSYNVVQDGSANQIRDRLLMSFEWTEEFYKNECAGALLKIVKGLVFVRDHQNRPFDLFDVHAHLVSVDRINQLSKAIGKADESLSKLVFDLFETLKNPTNFSYLQGLRSQIESLLYSDFGHLFKQSENGINLFEAIEKGKIVYILLDSRRYGESSKALGKMILEDLKSTSAKIDNEIKKTDRTPFTVVVDEFADMATEGFIGFLDRARSSKIGVVVAHQEVADLDRISPEFRRRLMNSTSTLFSFLQKDPESSELIAGMAGTKTSTAETERAESGIFGNKMSGQKSVREIEEYNVHPNVIRSLKVGECVLIEKYPSSRSRKINIRPPALTTAYESVSESYSNAQTEVRVDRKSGFEHSNMRSQPRDLKKDSRPI